MSACLSVQTADEGAEVTEGRGKRKCPRKEDRGDTKGPWEGQGEQFQEKVWRGWTSGPEGWAKDTSELATGIV